MCRLVRREAHQEAAILPRSFEILRDQNRRIEIGLDDNPRRQALWGVGDYGERRSGKGLTPRCGWRSPTMALAAPIFPAAPAFWG